MRELYIRNMIANIALIWNNLSEWSVSVCVCVYVCLYRLHGDGKSARGKFTQSYKRPASLFSHESICLLTSSVPAQNTSNHREYIHIKIYRKWSCCVVYVVVDVVVIWNFHRCWSHQSIEIEKKWTKKKIIPKKKRRNFRCTWRISIAIEVQCGRIPFSFFPTQLLMCFSLPIASCLLFIFFLFSSTFWLILFHFFIFFHSFVRWLSWIFSFPNSFSHKLRRQRWSKSRPVRLLHVSSHSLRLRCLCD